MQARGQGFDSLILHEPEGIWFIDIMEEEDTRRYEVKRLTRIEQRKKSKRANNVMSFMVYVK